MNKILITLLLAFPLLITSCSCSQTGKTRSREDTEGDKENEPAIPEGEPSIDPPEKEKLVSDLTEGEYKNFPTFYLKKLSNYTSYKSETHGSTKAKVSILGIPIETEQSIDVEVVKGEYSYLKNESHSSLVNTVHTAYFHDKDVVSNNGNGYSKTTLSEYLNTYGTYPFDNAIEGYTISENSITSIENISEQGAENYKFKIVFNTENCTNNVKIQMREFGGLDDYPVINKVEIVLTVQNNFTPISLDLESDYVAKKGMESSCHQAYTVTFSNFNETIECPGLSDVIEQFGNNN